MAEALKACNEAQRSAIQCSAMQETAMQGHVSQCNASHSEFVFTSWQHGSDLNAVLHD